MLVVFKTNKNKEKLKREIKKLNNYLNSENCPLTFTGYESDDNKTNQIIKRSVQEDVRKCVLLAMISNYKFDKKGYLVDKETDRNIEFALYKLGIRQSIGKRIKQNRKLKKRALMGLGAGIAATALVNVTLPPIQTHFRRIETENYLKSKYPNYNGLYVYVNSEDRRIVCGDNHRPMDYDDGVNVIIKRAKDLGLNNVEAAALVHSCYGDYYILDSYVYSLLDTTEEEVNEYLDNLYYTEVKNNKKTLKLTK